MGGRTAIERLLGRAVPAHRVDLGDITRRSMSDVEEDGAAAGPLTDARARRWVDAPSWRVSSPHPRAAARDLPTQRVDPSTAGGSGHGIFTKGESRNLLLHHLKNLRSSPSNFYPDLDPRT
jgi:hypothetical protein